MVGILIESLLPHVIPMILIPNVVMRGTSIRVYKFLTFYYDCSNEKKWKFKQCTRRYNFLNFLVMFVWESELKGNVIMIKKIYNLILSVMFVIAAFIVLPWQVFNLNADPKDIYAIAYVVAGPIIAFLGMWFYRKIDQRYRYYFLLEIVCIMLSVYLFNFDSFISLVVPTTILCVMIVQGIYIGIYRVLKYLFCW